MTLRDGKLKAVYKKGDKFCDAKKVKGKKTFTPIESQPENVIELVRNYSVLKKNATYRRRVSWLGIGIYHLSCTLLSICRRVKS
jgi:Zn-dependent peptidase ImmA (M78 family)